MSSFAASCCMSFPAAFTASATMACSPTPAAASTWLERVSCCKCRSLLRQPRRSKPRPRLPRRPSFAHTAVPPCASWKSWLARRRFGRHHRCELQHDYRASDRFPSPPRDSGRLRRAQLQPRAKPACPLQTCLPPCRSALSTEPEPSPRGGIDAAVALPTIQIAIAATLPSQRQRRPTRFPPLGLVRRLPARAGIDTRACA